MTKPAKPKKPATKKNASQKKTRVITPKEQKYKSFKLSKRLKHPVGLPKARSIFAEAWRTIRGQKKIFLSILGLFFVLTTLLVRGFSGGADAEEVKFLIEDLIEGRLGQLVGGTAVISLLVTSAANAPSDVASVYQSILFLLVSLAVLYTLRKTYSNESVGLREAFYQSTYPLIPFLLVLFVIGLQLIPFAIGGWLFATVSVGGLAVHAAEQVMWAAMFFLLALLSLYMISSSIFAAYIVTLPGMRPMQALRSARELVRLRRWAVIRKILFLPLALSLIGLVVLLPIAIFLTPLAEFSVILYALFSVIFFHSYMYGLYRSLL